MSASRATRRIVLATSLVAAAVLVACSSSDSASTTNLTVTPALGAVYGGQVDVYNSSGGLLGTGTTSATTGSANLVLNGYVTGTPIIVKLTMINGSSYYDEKSTLVKPVTVAAGTAATSLLSFAPSVTSGAAVGVTPASHMAAKLAGLSTTTLTGGATLSATTITKAVGAANLILGLPSGTNLLKAPVPATSNTAPTDIYGALMFAVAKVAAVDALSQATALFDSVPAMAADGSVSITDNTKYAAIVAANAAMVAAKPTLTSSIPPTVSVGTPLTLTASQVTTASNNVSTNISTPASGSVTGSASGANQAF